MSTTIDKAKFVDSLIIKYVDASDIDRAFQLESEGIFHLIIQIYKKKNKIKIIIIFSLHNLKFNIGYPPEEAATLETLKYRQKVASKLFLGAYIPSSSSSPSQLIGFVVSTSTLSDSLTHESMSLHEEEGK